MTIAAAFPFLFLSSIVEGNSMDVHPHVQGQVSLKAKGEGYSHLPEDERTEHKSKDTIKPVYIRWYCKDRECKRRVDNLMEFLSCKQKYKRVRVEALVHDGAAEPELNSFSRATYKKAVEDHYPSYTGLNKFMGKFHGKTSSLTNEERECLDKVQIVEDVTHDKQYQPTPIEQLQKINRFLVPDELLEPKSAGGSEKKVISKTEYNGELLTYNGKTLEKEINSMMERNPKGLLYFGKEKKEIGDLLEFLVAVIKDTLFLAISKDSPYDFGF